MTTTIHLKNGKVFDSTNRDFNKKKDVFISAGKIVNSLNKKYDWIIDCNDKIVITNFTLQKN